MKLSQAIKFIEEYPCLSGLSVECVYGLTRIQMVWLLEAKEVGFNKTVQLE